MAISFSLLAQEEQAETDTLFTRIDLLTLDTVAPQYMRVSSNAIDKQVTYSSAGKVRRDIRNQQVILTNQAVVRYGDIEIQADSIVFNMASNLLYAIGISDSTGKVTGSPVFKEGSNEFNSELLMYNFQTRRAFVKNTSTKQGEGIVNSTYSKMLEDGTANIALSTYSTCDANPPHFYISIPKGRVYPGEKMVTGPAHLVVEGIPIKPLFIPFGYFPVNTDRSSSGILFPSYGQERIRGYSLTNMGYYFHINDYIDFRVQGDVYTNGEWRANVQSNYIKLYKYSGNLNFNYAKNVTGTKFLPDYNESTNYSLGWSFRQDPKASPGSSFSANVNMSSASYNRLNSYEIQNNVATTQSSSISYSKTWAGTPFNLSTSMNHSQNNQTKNVDLNLPKLSLTMSRIYPLKMGGKAAGRNKWYHDLQFQYSATLDNRIKTTDSLLFTSHAFDNMDNGFEHRAPLSLQIKPFKNFSISPSLTYTGVAYTKKVERYWDANAEEVVRDTVSGAFYGHALNPTISASYSPQIFGTYAFINPDARIQAVRHIIRPSFGFNFTPDHKLSSNMFRSVQNSPTDSLGNARYETYSIFDGRIYGTPRTSGKSGSVSFNLVNILEAKVFSKNDTTGIPKKVKLIDNISTGVSYNIFADSMRWNFNSIQARTTLFENISVSATGNFSLYAIDSLGSPYNKFYLSTNGKPLRFISFGTSVDFSLDRLLKGKGAGSQPQSGFNPPMDDRHDHSGDNIYGYQPFDMPWTLNVSYSFNYNKNPRGKPTVSNGLSMNGSVTITKNMRANVNSGYDFSSKQITSTQIGINRDLHCWEMNFSWSPVGAWQFWNFTIRAKASILRDLKYDRKNTFRDSF